MKGAAGKVSLGVFALAMIEVSAVLTVRNFPSMAEEGWSLVGWYILGLLLFFLPLSLAGAELATGWPKGGGVYAWVREAFGENRGFIAIWCEWAENVVWFPTVLSFVTATLAFGLAPILDTSPVLNLLVMLLIFWGITVLNFYGEKYGSMLSSAGGVFGSMLPAAVLVILMVVYIAQGKSSVLQFSGFGDLLPSFSLDTLPFVQTVVLLFAGMEMAGFHARETANPGRDFPRAILISAVIVFVLSTLGTLAIAYTVPTKDLSLAGGVMQAIETMLSSVGVKWLVAPMAILVAFGAVAQLSTWLIGPAKALGVAAAQGDMPPRWRSHNSFGSPVAVLVIQGVLTTGFALMFILIPSVNSAYWILSALTTQVIIVMYLLMFAALIKLRYSQPDTPRAYTIPGGKPGVWVVSGVALGALVFSFVIGLLPPEGTKASMPVYVSGMFLATLVLSVGVPALFYLFRKPSWRAENAEAYLEGEE